MSRSAYDWKRLAEEMEQAMRTLVVMATWDAEAGVWVAESDDIPGLATEASTRDVLVAKPRVMIPELYEANRPHARIPCTPFDFPGD